MFSINVSTIPFSINYTSFSSFLKILLLSSEEDGGFINELQTEDSEEDKESNLKGVI